MAGGCAKSKVGTQHNSNALYRRMRVPKDMFRSICSRPAVFPVAFGALRIRELARYFVVPVLVLRGNRASARFATASIRDAQPLTECVSFESGHSRRC